MPRHLSQFVAIKKETEELYTRAQAAALSRLGQAARHSGIARTYRPKDDQGEQLPAESTRVQLKAHETLSEFGAVLTQYFDVIATNDYGNTIARSDIVVDGEVILSNVPVDFLLFLEKQLKSMQTFLKAIPTLDPSEEWGYDRAQDCYATPPTETTRTKKVPRNHIKAEATDRFPAQVEVYHEDIVVGTWKTIKYSGAMPASEVNALLARVQKVQQAVTFAREEANRTDVNTPHVGSILVKYLFSLPAKSTT